MDSERSQGSRTLVSVVVVVVSVALNAQSTEGLRLPPRAVVIERSTIPQEIHRDRELVLWMLSPQRHDRGEFSGTNSYTCPEMTLGSYYAGPTRISLMDTSADRVVNTLILRHADGSEDSFDVPYRILADYYYLVPGNKDGAEGKPALLALRDLNGDGLPLETAFFEAEACMGLPTTLIGYSPTRDRVIQYEVELKITEQKTVEGRGIVNTGSPVTETSTWGTTCSPRSQFGPGTGRTRSTIPDGAALLTPTMSTTIPLARSFSGHSPCSVLLGVPNRIRSGLLILTLPP